ncbi:HAMP domain-containing sensor histidine kinase [Clostridium pasteurianum]|nr:HAMP domain-containing sensor histidine kinase [Clostridium pasteurianum]UZW15651.1 HAMP domain-containing sensor histidine kinase [Clostridium pasteurianum]
MKFTIKYKFSIGILLIFCLSFNAMNYFMDKIIIQNNKKVISNELLNSQRDLNIFIRQFMLINNMDISQNGFHVNRESIGNGLASKINNRVILYSNSGDFIFDSEDANGYIFSQETKKLSDDHADLKMAEQDKSAYKIIKINSKYLVVFSQTLYANNERLGIIRYVKDNTELFETSNELLTKIKMFMGGIFLIVTLFAILLASKITKPIVKLSRITKEIAEGKFDITISVKSKDEIGELEESFNKMKEKISEQIATIKKDRDDLIKLQGHKKNFFDNVTHEMKTPLTIINGYSQMILDEGASNEVILKKAASKIKRESEKLHNMIIDVLDMSKIESKVNIDNRENLYMFSIVNGICDDLAVKAKKYEITFERCIVEDINVFANKDEISRMLINIIDNSIKYANVKSIIKVKLYRDKGNCVITVEDSGIGISKESLSKIFNPFYRVNKKICRERGNSGLGLAIVKAIVDKYDGNINIESEINKGTKVKIKIPLFLQVGNNLVK